MTDNNIRVAFPWASILTVLFIYLKLTGTITWSWWWVFAPLWLPLLAILGIMAIVFLVLLLIELVTG